MPFDFLHVSDYRPYFDKRPTTYRHSLYQSTSCYIIFSKNMNTLSYGFIAKIIPFNEYSERSEVGFRSHIWIYWIWIVRSFAKASFKWCNHFVKRYCYQFGDGMHFEGKTPWDSHGIIKATKKGFPESIRAELLAI